MKHLFVPYELALYLNEKGFDDFSLGLSYLEEKEGLYDKGEIVKIHPKEINSKKNFIAPIYQQAIDWLYEKGISLEIYSCDQGKNFNHIIRKVGRNIYEMKSLENKPLPNRNEVMNRGIKEALKLIG